MMDDKELEELLNVQKKPFWKEALDYIIWLVGVIVTVQLIIHFVGVFSVVDGESMEPTLYNKEYLWVDKLKYHFKEPERFDVVIFPVESRGSSTYYVKRIIGLPGETVFIDEKGNIMVDGEVLNEGYGKEVIQHYTRGNADEPITLGEDEYFVLGDNRNHSSDSRYPSVGNIKREEILGRALVRLWPLNKIGLVD